MSEILIRNADVVVTMDAARAERAGCDVLIRGGVIAAVGQGLQTTGAVIEGAGCVVTPGLVNTHHHLYQTLTRAVPGRPVVRAGQMVTIDLPLVVERQNRLARALMG